MNFFNKVNKNYIILKEQWLKVLEFEKDNRKIIAVY